MWGEKKVQNLKIAENSPKITFFSPIRWFGNLPRSFGRTTSAGNDRSFGRSFGFGRSLSTIMRSSDYEQQDSALESHEFSP